VKFFVIPIYPISTFLVAINWLASWELVAAAVEYFFMGNGSQKHERIAESHNDSRYLGISGLNAKAQPDIVSGRYRLKDTVPI
jgi:hypothetical protein